MRWPALLWVLPIAAACNRQVPEEAQREKAPAAVDQAVPVPSAEPGGEPESTQVAIPEAPPEDPGLASLSPSRRREYERGYRDCRQGEFNYDSQTQGEYYRIGCMAAENLKAVDD